MYLSLILVGMGIVNLDRLILSVYRVLFSFSRDVPLTIDES